PPGRGEGRTEFRRVVHRAGGQGGGIARYDHAGEHALRQIVRFVLMAIMSTTLAAATTLDQRLDAAASGVESKVIECRRDIHQHPELGNRETRTSKLIADRLKALGIEVKTPIAHTGVVGILKGGKPGRVVALRADMDALPVAEQVDLPFRS